MSPEAGDQPRRARRRSSFPVGFDLDESKLLVPQARPGVVARRALLDALSSQDPAPLIAVVAPPGYGKSTLLAEFANLKSTRVAWVSVDERDNDPAVLFTYLAVALDRVERFEPRVFRSVTTRGVGVADVVRLVSAIARMSQPVLLVLDHAESLTNSECHDMVAELALRLPAGSQLAIGSRRPVPVPVPRLRAQRGIVEVGRDDLAMDAGEAAALLAGAGVDLAPADVDRLVARTEGWPAGLYLAALAVNAGGPHLAAASSVTGTERFIAEYLRSEFLDRVSRSDVLFLTRTSILDRMCAPLCDATVGRTGSGRVLQRLEQRNLLVIPMDRDGEWYRYHHLFGELLRGELLRREPEMINELHLRAASWYEANGLPEAGLEHVERAGDVERAARLVLTLANPGWASGRLDTVLRWMQWFADNDLIEKQPAVAVHGALIFALVGKVADAERWAAAAQRTTRTGALSDGNTMEATLAYLRTLMCANGIEEMRRDALSALEGLSPTSPYRAAMVHAEGASHLLSGDPDLADSCFVRAAEEATRIGATPFMPLLLAERGIVAIGRGDWPAAEALAAEALGLMQPEFDDYWTTSLPYAWAARVAAHRADLSSARDLAARAARLRPVLTYALPVVSAQALLELAHAYTAIADPGGARAVLRQMQDILYRRPWLGSLARQSAELSTELERTRADALGVSSLTTAELRLLPLLPTHLTLAEISERLLVSRNTIKTQAISIYHKLGVSSRGETVARMYDLGLAVEPESPRTAR